MNQSDGTSESKGGLRMSKPTKRQSEDRLRPHKVVRDPVHGDIQLTKAEVAIIDTPEFQRLRFIRQLGSSYLVYPGAEHSRFQHSLGTLAMADRVVESINHNIKGNRDVTDEERFVIRLVALLHDITHIPFGHTLENELCCYEQDHDTRFEAFIGPKTEIGKMLVGFGVLDQVAELLSAKPAKEGQAILTRSPKRKTFDPLLVEQLDSPFMADIVKNTICADLLDYAARDTYFSGLRQSYDPRLFAYFEIDEKNRLALRLQNRDDVRRGVLSEVLHLLKLRYSLGERVYYHHAKMTTSAMLARAFLESGLSAADFYTVGDEAALDVIGAKGGLAGDLVRMLKRRSMYRPVYVIGCKLNNNEKQRIVHAYLKDERGTLKARERRDLENTAAIECGLKEGEVLVYCTSEKMSLKAARVRVRWARGFVMPLDEVADAAVQQEILSIQEKHHALWRLLVLVHPCVPQKKLQEVSDWAYNRFGHMNELVEFTKEISPPSRHHLREASLDLGRTVQDEGDVIEFALKKVARTKGSPPDTVGQWKQAYEDMDHAQRGPDQPRLIDDTDSPHGDSHDPSSPLVS